MVKRAIALAGGGPAVGLSIGALKRLEEEPDITFDVVSTACIGAWLAVTYYQAPKGQGLAATQKFFRQVFQPEDTYSRFPVAPVFAPNFPKMVENTIAFVLDPANYHNLVVPHKIQEATTDLMNFMSNPLRWNVADFNTTMLNSVFAANPITRFFTSLTYLSRNKGLSQVFYPDSPVLAKIDFDALYEPDKPCIYHNAYNLTRQELQLFCNKPEQNLPKITPRSLCACSALPYIEDTVEIDGETYCEGATVDTVNFEDLLINHPDLEEVWVSRILDRKQVRKPENLYDALNNLVMLFAATTSEDDVKMFRLHLERTKRDVKVVEIPVAHHINYDWTLQNLDRSIRDGYDATSKTLLKYRAGEPTAAPLSATVTDGEMQHDPDGSGGAGASVTPMRRGRRGPKRAA